MPGVLFLVGFNNFDWTTRLLLELHALAGPFLCALDVPYFFDQMPWLLFVFTARLVRVLFEGSIYSLESLQTSMTAG